MTTTNRIDDEIPTIEELSDIHISDLNNIEKKYEIRQKASSLPERRTAYQQGSKRQSRFGTFKKSVKRQISGSIRSIGAYAGRLAKPANAYIRWNLLFTFLIFLFITSAIWIPCIPAVNDFALEIVTIISIILHCLWIIAIINALRYTWRLRRFASHEIRLDLVKNEAGLKMKHLVGLCVYKEPLDLLMDTIESIASQPNAKEKITCLVGMEGGTPDKEEKKRILDNKYGPKFERFIVTFHPRGLPGDIPGKCSNFNYAARTAVKMLRADKNYPLEEYDNNVELIVTTGDCDSVFGDRYFDALEEDYWKISAKQRSYTVWQSPLFYCINLDQSPFFVRITGLLRAFFMMGYLIPWNINTMSIFSLTLKLFEEGEYTHPGYQMDDIIALIRWSLAVRRKCVIRAIPVATLSGPTSGKNYIDEWYEWARQIRRWTIGAAEVFHYFAIKFFRLPVTVSISFAAKFVFYYGFLLCIASIYTLIAPIVTPAMLNAVDHGVNGLVIPNNKCFMIIMFGFLGLQYIWFFTVFLVNYLCQPVFPRQTKDKTGIIRNIFHWLMTWPTLIMYCCVELVAFLEVTVRGKSVCSHNASKKDNLVAPVPSKQPDRMEV
ncbi:Glycosyltransferase 2-like domain-containing protein [Caenorhabditis elegans]|uniref:Glycosyltransferase 2-like domain-containing protein n=1 Tax=Caenorhabditis elegans TaxID=6239 RepID=Q93199_CAEEL|nr:Glycosyltransferase 2-like domain-containing protein [Caenorhabditis elegans]CAB01720.2 Glycosyltransferase 2-like domain-containing protein [Caenorhabditis elegans]|eukprot:NP_509848.2 Uncharacterized protein CELE_C09F12.2 [Caenorhabditis elegans]